MTGCRGFCERGTGRLIPRPQDPRASGADVSRRRRMSFELRPRIAQQCFVPFHVAAPAPDASANRRCHLGAVSN